MTDKGFIIAIDGPVASGKGTIAPLLAKKLHGFYLATGMMYRCVGFACMRNNISTTDESAIKKLLPSITLDMTEEGVFLNGENVTKPVLTQEIAMAASNVSVFPSVRAAVRKRQQEVGYREIQRGKVVIAEGRDAATKIFPDAALQVFLTAKPEIRAQRRYEQILKKGNERIAYEQVLADTNARDKQDTERKTDPLVSNPEKHGYIIIDDSDQTKEETVQRFLDALREKKLYNGAL